MRTAALAVPLALALISAPLAAQEPWVAAPSCLSDWSCSHARPPLGLYVRAVDEGGRYVILEDGSVWEVEISDRATAASWRPDDFVGIRFIAAPRGDYEHLLTRAAQGEQRAAARLAGRREPGFRTGDTVPGQPDD